MATVTSTIASSALRGQSVMVNLSGADSAKLAAMYLGQKATISSSGNMGYIDGIDLYGTSFRVKPSAPNLFWQSTLLGFLAASETITLA